MGPTIKTVGVYSALNRNGGAANLAAHAGVSRQTIKSIPKGKYHPNLRQAFKIARVFGNHVEDVFVYRKTERRDELNLSSSLLRMTILLSVHWPVYSTLDTISDSHNNRISPVF